MKTLALAAVLLAVGIGAPARGADSGAKAEFDRESHEFVAAWNVHDTKRMAAVWAQDGDLINPFGRVAKTHAEIEKLFVEEHGGALKGTTYTIESSTLREIGKDVAVGDWTSTVTGITGPDGSAQPPFHHHVTQVFVKTGGRWQLEVARAYVFATTPPEPAK